MTAGLLTLVACTSADRAGRRPHDTDPPAADTETGTSAGTASTGDTAAVPATGDTGAPLDCSVLPPLPVQYVRMPEFETNEDFDLDGDGYLCTNIDQDLRCRDLAGDTKMVAPGISLTSGIRVLASGDWLVNNQLTGTVTHVSAATGAKTPALTGLNYPNGLEIGRDGWIFVAEHGAGNVRQFDVATGDQHLAATGLVDPNGVILSPDEQTLYVNSFGAGVVWAVDRLGPTDWDTPRVLHAAAGGTGEFDGINVDSCGNVYVTEYTVGRIYRITADGTGNGVVADLEEGWIPNLRWGHDLGGWSSSTLYVAAWDSVYALDMGIPGKKHVLVP